MIPRPASLTSRLLCSLFWTRPAWVLHVTLQWSAGDSVSLCHSPLWTWNLLRTRSRLQVSLSSSCGPGQHVCGAVRQEAQVGGPGCTARLLSSTSASTDGFCQGDSSQLLPACPLAWLRRSLQASSTRLFFQLTFLCPFMSQEVSKLLEGRAW